MFIDIDTEQWLSDSDVRGRFLPVIYRDASVLTLSQLHSVRVAKVVEKPEPEIVRPYESLRDKWIKITGKWSRDWIVESCSLEDARRYRQAELEQMYIHEKNQPVEYDGKLWSGGYESAQLIMGSIEMRDFLGQDRVTLFDTSGNATEYTITEARHIALAIGSAYEQTRAKKAAVTLALNGALTVEEVKSVIWL